MSMSGVRVAAKTRILIEFNHECGPWGEDISMKDLRKQAENSAGEYGERVITILREQRIKARLVKIHTPTVDLGSRP